ncbi:hypothetical protein C8F01DRAFT_1228862 [Mycena amicta]|nr:hypothetical protein C8F01DRAFT_1228862 [Mycena amicta]
MSSDVIVAARLNAKSQVSSKFLFKLPIQSQVLIGPTDKSKLLFARSENPTKNKVKALLLLSHNPRTLLNFSGAIPLQVPPKLWPILCQGAGPLDWSGSVIKKIAVMSVPGIVPVTPAASGEVGLSGLLYNAGSASSSVPNEPVVLRGSSTPSQLLFTVADISQLAIRDSY